MLVSFGGRRKIGMKALLLMDQVDPRVAQVMVVAEFLLKVVEGKLELPA
jgi:hypothetical protein